MGPTGGRPRREVEGLGGGLRVGAGAVQAGAPPVPRGGVVVIVGVGGGGGVRLRGEGGGPAAGELPPDGREVAFRGGRLWHKAPEESGKGGEVNLAVSVCGNRVRPPPVPKVGHPALSTGWMDMAVSVFAVPGGPLLSPPSTHSCTREGAGNRVPAAPGQSMSWDPCKAPPLESNGAMGVGLGVGQRRAPEVL